LDTKITASFGKASGGPIAFGRKKAGVRIIRTPASSYHKKSPLPTSKAADI